MGAQHSPAGGGVEYVDNSADRVHVDGRRRKIRRRSYSQTLDAGLTFHNYAVTGVLAALLIVFLVKVALTV